MSLAARASFVSDSESQVYEAVGELDPAMDSSPRPPPKVTKSQSQSMPSVEKRLEKIERELRELDTEFDSGSHSTMNRLEDPVVEMSKVVNEANGIAKKLGISGIDWTSQSEITRKLAAAIGGGLSTEKDLTCEISAVLPSPTEDIPTLIKAIQSRISGLETCVGAWLPTLGFLTVAHSLSSSHKTISKLNPAQVAILDDLAENISTEFDVVSYRREMLFGMDSDPLLIEKLYDLLSEIHRVQPSLPLLIQRLTELKRVHEEGAAFRSRIKEVAEKLTLAEAKLANTGLEALVAVWREFKARVETTLSSLQNKS